MAATSQRVVVNINGVPTILEIDSDLWGTGTVASRPASGDNVGDIYIVQDPPLYAFDIWNGSAWIRATVIGPSGGSVDNRVVRWDGTGGDQLQNSLVTVDDSGNIDNSEGQFNSTRHYNDSATDPVSPTPAEGDRYYNTTLEMEMRYDGSRSKWLSVESIDIVFARSGNTAAGSFFRSVNDRTFSSTVGRLAEFNGTVVSMTYTRSDTDSATMEVTRDGTLVTGATLASTALEGSDTTLNADFASGGVLGVRNQSGGNTMSNVLGWVRVRWRA